MRLIFELRNRYFQLETGEITSTDAVDIDEAEEIELTGGGEAIRLPLGFELPPPADEGDSDDEEYETPEADCG